MFGTEEFKRLKKQLQKNRVHQHTSAFTQTCSHGHKYEIVESSRTGYFKGPVLYSFSGLCFPSQTPSERTLMSN